MRVRRTAAALLAAVALALGCASQRPNSRELGPPATWSAVASSGIMVIVHSGAASGRMELVVLFGGAGASDPPGKEGLAELARRMSERARDLGPREPDRFDRLFAAGVEAWSELTPDATVFHARGPAEALGTVLDVERQRIVNPLCGLEQEDLDALRSEALRGTGEAPFSGEVWEAHRLLARAFAEHPYGRAFSAAPATTLAVSLEDVRAAAKTRFRPSNAVLVVFTSGDPRVVAEQVVRHLGDVLSSPTGFRVAPELAPAPRAPEEPVIELPMAVERGATTVPRLWVAWILPGGADPSFGLGALAAALTVAGVHERLRAQPWHDRVTRFGSLIVPGADALLLAMSLDLSAEADAGPVVHGVADAVQALADAARPEAADQAFLRALDRSVATAPLDLAEVAMVARLGFGPERAVALRSVLAAAGRPGELQAYRRARLGPDHMLRVLFLPGPSGGAPALGIRPPAPVRYPSADFQPPGTEQVRSLLGAVLGDETARRLGTGLGVRLASLPGATTVVGYLVVSTEPEGTLATPAGLPGVALPAARRAGAEAAGFCFGGEATFSSDRVTFRTAGSLEEVVRALRCAVTRTAVDPAAFAAGLRLRFGAPARPATSVAPAVELELCEVGFPGWSCGPAGSAERSVALSPADGERWLSTALRPDRAVLVLTGAIASTQEANLTVNERFGDWKLHGEAAPPLTSAPLPARRTARIMAWPGAREAWVRAAIRSAGSDGGGLEALAWAIDERLARFVAARNSGHTRVQADLDRRGDAPSLTALVPRGAVGELVEELRAQAADASARLGSAQDADRARWMAARTMYAALANEDRAPVWLGAVARRGAAPVSVAEDLASLGAARIQAAARALALDRMVVVAAGDPDALTSQLRAAGFEVEVVAERPATR